MEDSSLSQAPAAPVDGAGCNARPFSEADAELARQMMSGNDAAFATFYDRFAPDLFPMVYAILRDQKESEDVLQEAFVQMWKRVATYNAQRSSLFTWAVMISRHKAIDRLRARQRQQRLVETVASKSGYATTPAEPERADDILARSDERARVRAALARLSDGQREALDLAFFGGLTQLQVAQKLGAPLGTVKARVRRGLVALRNLLGGVSS